jgi:hypothetical protein
MQRVQSVREGPGRRPKTAGNIGEAVVRAPHKYVSRLGNGGCGAEFGSMENIEQGEVTTLRRYPPMRTPLAVG